MPYLYGHKISNQETCVDYLLERNLLPELDSCRKLKNGVVRGGTLKE